eukprot:9638374-Ditylum_brightwellii.AAC.1
MDVFDDLNTRYQWIKITKQIPDRVTGRAVAPVNRDLLQQYRLLDLNVIKRHAHQYFGNDSRTNNVPAPGAMAITDLTPDTDNTHRTLFYNC